MQHIHSFSINASAFLANVGQDVTLFVLIFVSNVSTTYSYSSIHLNWSQSSKGTHVASLSYKENTAWI